MEAEGGGKSLSKVKRESENNGGREHLKEYMKAGREECGEIKGIRRGKRHAGGLE